MSGNRGKHFQGWNREANWSTEQENGAADLSVHKGYGRKTWSKLLEWEENKTVKLTWAAVGGEEEIKAACKGLFNRLLLPFCEEKAFPWGERSWSLVKTLEKSAVLSGSVRNNGDHEITCSKRELCLHITDNSSSWQQHSVQNLPVV